MRARITEVDLAATIFDGRAMHNRKASIDNHMVAMSYVFFGPDKTIVVELEIELSTGNAHPSETLWHAFGNPFMKEQLPFTMEGSNTPAIVRRTSNVYLYDDDWNAYGVMRRPFTTGLWSKCTGRNIAIIVSGAFEPGEDALRKAMMEARLEAL